MAYESIAFGDQSDLERLRSLEEWQPEGTLAELRLNFRLRFWGFGQAAWLLNQALEFARVTPWPGAEAVVYVDPDEPLWYIRWMKGALWVPVIIAALVGTAVVMLYLARWQLLRLLDDGVPPGDGDGVPPGDGDGVPPGDGGGLPSWVLPVLAGGGLGLGLLALVAVAGRRRAR